MTNSSVAGSSDYWKDDLFERKEEARLLAGYIESLAGRQTLGGDAKAHTIAVDAGYGEGKTFFLKRLSKQLAHDHPVAFVDAWVDDLADEPLTALAATLREALDPLIKSSEKIRDRWAQVVGTSGKVAKIVAEGLAKRALGLAIGAGSVEALEHISTGLADDTVGVLQDGLKEMGTAASSESMSTFKGVAPDKLMLDRIASFEEGRSAIRQMKASLSALIEELKNANCVLQPPIIIIIDELDRCRPTYAVKVLEEVKHLFDVPGLIFIFGMYGDQLAHSVAGAYGPGFNGLGYLRRFFDRRYRLAEPSLEPLVKQLLKRTGLADGFNSPAIGGPGTSNGERRPSEIISRYMRAYDLRARDAFELVDMLQTAVALAEGRPLHLPYLMPLIIGHLKHLPAGEIPAPTINPAWHFQIDDRHSRREVDLLNLAREYEAAATMTDQQFDTAESQDRLTVVEQAVRTTREPYQFTQPLGAVPMYPKLVATIGRFTNPKIAADEPEPTAENS